MEASLQCIIKPIATSVKKSTFSLGFKLTLADFDWVDAHKKNGWTVSKPIPHITKNIDKPKYEENDEDFNQEDIDEIYQGLGEMMYETNMVHVGKGPGCADVQYMGPNFKLNNWKATLFLTRKESL